MSIRPVELDYAILNHLTSGLKNFSGLAFELKHAYGQPSAELPIGEIEQSIIRDAELNFIAPYLPLGEKGGMVPVSFEREHVNLYWYTTTDHGKQQLKAAA